MLPRFERKGTDSTRATPSIRSLDSLEGVPQEVNVLSTGGGNLTNQPVPPQDHLDGGHSSFPEEKIERPLLTGHRSLMGVARGMKKPVRAFLSYYKKSAGGVNTATPHTFAIQPNQDSSWSAWQAVFDEVKIVSASIHYLVWWSTLPSGFAAQTPNMVIVYDPMGLSALSSVNEGLQWEKFQLTNLGGNANGTYAVEPQTTSTNGGYRVFKVVMPNGPQFSNTSTTLSTGIWRPTGDAVDYVWGIFKSYVAQGGASSVLQVEAFVRMEAEFRVRS
jgi:hypothetical protein